MRSPEAALSAAVSTTPSQSSALRRMAISSALVHLCASFRGGTDRGAADGGWGETHESYRHPERAGLAPSMPAVTGIVVVALVSMGLRDHAAVVRATQYLLNEQRPDGTWNHNDFLHTFNPPDTFYVLQDATHFWPLEALGCVLNAVDPPLRIDALESRREEFRDAMRRQGDPAADAAAASLFRGGVP